MALEWHADSAEQTSLRQRLKDSTSTLLTEYAELLRCGQVHGEIEQQIGEVRTKVLAAGMVQSADALLQLEDEVKRGLVLSENTLIAEEIATIAAAHESVASNGEHRLHQVVREMQAALRKLEENYYACSVREGESEQPPQPREE
jgi:methyl-accepting chemotaxis protein